ncbi:hypothetical protein DV736_g4025, partial [Chaetothyriales sp. CBS 134916]
MESPELVKCTYDNCNFYFATEKEMIRHKKNDPDHFYCHKCNEDFENDTEYMIHQILSVKHTVCPSCGMEHIEKDQCRVIRRRDFERERAERSILKDAFVQALGPLQGSGATRISSITSASSVGSNSVHGGVSLLQSTGVHIGREWQVEDRAALMNSPQSQTPLTDFPALPATQKNRPSASSHRLTDDLADVNDVSDKLSTVSLNKEPIWMQHQGHRHLFPVRENVSPSPLIIEGTNSKYDQLSEVSFQTAGSQSNVRKMLDYTSQAELVPPAAPRYPEPNAHITTCPPPRSSRLDIDKFFDPNLRCYQCPGIKCQGRFTTSEQFRTHLQGPTHAGSHVICPSCLRRFKTTTALMSHMESGSKRCNARNTTNYNQLLREVSAGLIGTSGQLEDGSVKYSVPNDEGWEENPDTVLRRW